MLIYRFSGAFSSCICSGSKVYYILKRERRQDTAGLGPRRAPVTSHKVKRHTHHHGMNFPRHGLIIPICMTVFKCERGIVSP